MAKKDLRTNEKILRKAAEALNTEPEQVPAVLKKFQKDISEAEEEIEKLKLRAPQPAIAFPPTNGVSSETGFSVG